VVGTYDGANIRLFVDGAEVGSGTPTNVRIAYGLPTTNNLFLGSYRGDTTSIFNGLVDEPSVYNRALSPGEIQAIFAAGSAGKTGVMGLVGSRVTLDGGPGTNTLDYSAFTGNVLVNLRLNSATGVLGGLSNIQNVAGGTGGVAGSYNILVGKGGNVLTGGNGRRNLLIAGPTPSTLIGGDGDDILIGGTTAYDLEAGMASLQAIMAYWAGSADDYATRVNNLITGNGVPALAPYDPTQMTGQVVGNGGGNTLTGGPGLDLFFGDQVLDMNDWDALTEMFFSV
jgi:Ca2+-binding RTX toxin-like protein